ncbi:MAG: DUF1349 domain-containing protein [Bryobacterales bacterium]|nr:DUF1349 domain-containing protein [Bryobacterales bacterium]
MFEQHPKTGFKWRNPPLRWEVDPASRRLVVEPAGHTDYWSKTAYGFEADNGPALLAEAQGDFVLATRVRFHPAHRYDQAGLLVLCSRQCWLKTSVEYEPDGPAHLGAVVTNRGYSDWSFEEYPPECPDVELRVRLRAGDCLVECRTGDGPWRWLRVAHLEERPAECGIYACSPKAAGFRAEFDFVRLEPFDAGLPFFAEL